jgi:hypothetical protein
MDMAKTVVRFKLTQKAALEAAKKAAAEEKAKAAENK